jgi:parallel beta-helix repeat protein
LYRKISGILISLALVLSLCLTASLHVMAAATWYVDDSNAGAEDGTQAHPFNTITEAVTAALAGDTIIVAGGTYAETVSVNKSLEIRAKSGETPEITIAGIGFSITANGVTIDGFTITQATDGIHLNSVSSCTITGNTFDECSLISIKLTSANTNVILGNTCTGNTGVYTLYLENSHGNIITNNTCTGNEQGYGLIVYQSDGNTFAGNSFGVFDFGIYIGDSVDNIFTANTCSMNSNDGIHLVASDEFDLFLSNAFLYNTLDSNNYGMRILNTNINAPLVYFKNNNITNNALGVYNDGSGTLDATYNYWDGNTSDTGGSNPVNSASPLASEVTNTIPVAFVVTTSATTTTSTTTNTTVFTTTETTTEMMIGTVAVTLTETSTSTTTDTSTVTLLNPTTLTETQSVTTIDTQTSTSTQSVTSTDTQSLTFTVTFPQTVTDTATTTLTVTEVGVDVPLIIIIAVTGLLAGGLIVTILIRRI